MEINRDAPVFAAAEIQIAAPVDLVWQVEADIANWPEWNSGIQSAELLGSVAPGTVFKWKAGGMKIISELVDVQAPERLGWTGRTLGLRAVHLWHFTKVEGTTHVRTEESFEGPLARIFSGWLKRTLASSLETGLAALRAECERLATVGRTP